MKTRQFLEYPIFFLSINMKENKVKTLAFLSAIFGLKQTTLKQTHSPSQEFWEDFSEGVSQTMGLFFRPVLNPGSGRTMQPLLLSSSRLKTRSSGRASSPSGQEDSGITLLASFTKYLMDRNARCEIYV